LKNVAFTIEPTQCNKKSAQSQIIESRSGANPALRDKGAHQNSGARTSPIPDSLRFWIPKSHNHFPIE